jgi:excisionase family DNA binding protein
MPEGSYQAPEGYLTMAEALERLRIAKATLQKRVRDGVLPVYRDPLNRRVRLVKVEDLEQLRRPVPEGKAAA